MYSRRNSRYLSFIIFSIGFVALILLFNHRNRIKEQHEISMPERIFDSHNESAEKMNDRMSTDYSHLLNDLGKHEQWSLSSFLGKNENKSKYSRIGSKRKICILHIDTRPLERFSDVKDFEKMNYVSIAAYNSLFYAIQHGYDYLRITAPPISEYDDTWVKIAHFYDIIHKYDIVVCFDPDVYVRNPNISIEFLMERYNFTADSSFLMAADPNSKNNQDSKGRATLNMGFIIAQNNDLTKHILKRLAMCAEIIPDCEQWRYKWSREQRAFSEYFRDQLKVGSELIIAPCNELNGFEESSSGCTGRFITHAWTVKHTMRERLKKLMLENMMTILEQQMWKNHHAPIASTSDIKKLGI